MKEHFGQRFLVIYSGVLTAVFAISMLSGFMAAPKKISMEELDVQRINLVEPDGTLRMVISDKARFPGAIIRGREYPHARASAGMIFFNDEGTENGGLIFSGYKDKTGKVVNAGGSLTFDKYEQDQLVQLVGADDKDGHTAGLVVGDRPDRSIAGDLVEMQKVDAMPAPQREALIAARTKSGYYGSTRIKVTREDDGAARISLRDALGHPRIVMSVAADGASSLEFPDAEGKVLKQLTPATKS